jgi:hypothetical protein
MHRSIGFTRLNVFTYECLQAAQEGHQRCCTLCACTGVVYVATQHPVAVTVTLSMGDLP